MTFKYVYFLPIIICIWFPFTFIFTYILAVHNKDVYPVFPYISDTGNWSPESCFFGLMLNIGAIIMGAAMYVRYRQIRQLNEKTEFTPSVIKYNRVTLILGIFAAFGVCLVGNFQETNMLSIHILGAGLAFGLGTVYEIIQTYISFRIYPGFGSRITLITRTCCTVINCITCTVTTVCGALSYFQFTGEDLTKWAQTDGGFTNHFISAVAEWILASSTMIYFATFTNEFKIIASISEPIITLHV